MKTLTICVHGRKKEEDETISHTKNQRTRLDRLAERREGRVKKEKGFLFVVDLASSKDAG